ncbi:MAG: hypothetical protein Q3998_07155 [Porphyromonas sp.]|nr:hypothetical protein [Porphyromonas sp.]
MRYLHSKIVFALLLILSALALPACGKRGADSSYGDTIEVAPVEISRDSALYPESGFLQGVSGAFGGVIGDTYIYGGGCNFPDIPVADGGKKVFYKSLYMLSGEGDVWETTLLSSLPRSLAYGASVSLGGGDMLLFVGGVGEEGASNEITMLSKIGSSGEITISKYPFSLPFGWYEGAAAEHEKTLYFTGGWKDGELVTDLYAFSLRSGETTKVIPLPDGARLQPNLFTIDGYLFLFGGFFPGGDIRIPGEEPRVHRTAWKLNLSSPKRWEPLKEPRTGSDTPLSFIGATVAKDDVSGAVYSVGGVNPSLFQEAISRGYLLKKALAAQDADAEGRLREEQRSYLLHPESYYRFSSALVRYDHRKDDWKVLKDSGIFATAGSVLIAKEKRLMQIGGERKPGIRTFDAYICSME